MVDTSRDPPLFYCLSNMQAISCLTFVGGFVDGAGYDLLYSIFTTAITGNIIAAASDVYVEAKGVLPRLLVCIFIGLGRNCYLNEIALRYVLEQVGSWNDIVCSGGFGHLSRNDRGATFGLPRHR